CILSGAQRPPRESLAIRRPCQIPEGMFCVRAFEYRGDVFVIHVENPQTCLAVTRAVLVERDLLSIGRPYRVGNLADGFRCHLTHILSISVRSVDVKSLLGLDAFEKRKMLAVRRYVDVP